MNSIIDALKSQSGYTDDLQASYAGIVQLKNVAKGEVLQRAGDTASKVYYVRKGLLRSYTIDENGKEHIFMFAPEGWLIGDNTTLGQPGELFIDLLEDSEIEVIDAKLFNEKLMTMENVQERLVGLHRRIAVLQKRVIMLMSTPAIARYEHFVETYPQILQRVPQKMIASYLGITPEALSKVKNQRKK